MSAQDEQDQRLGRYIVTTYGEEAVRAFVPPPSQDISIWPCPSDTSSACGGRTALPLAVGLVMREGTALVAVGWVLGLGGGYALWRALSTFLRQDMKERREAAMEDELEQQQSKEPTLFADGTKISVSRPFNPRKEVSADAQYIASRIVRTMWTIFVLLPVVIGIIYAISTAK